MELAMVRAFQDAGFYCRKQPLSGSLGGQHRGDLVVGVLDDEFVVECKHRAVDFTRLYGWLTNRDALIVKADRCEPLVVLPLRKAVEVLRQAEEYRTRRALS